MAQDKQVWVNIILAVVLVCVIIGGALLYNDLSALEGRVDTIEVRSKALDVRLQSLEADVETMKSESSGNIVQRTIDFFGGLFSWAINILKGIVNAFCGIFGITI